MVISNPSLLHSNIKKYMTRRAVRLYGPIFKYEGLVRAVGWHSCNLDPGFAVKSFGNLFEAPSPLSKLRSTKA